MGYQTNYNLTMPRNPITPEQLAAWIASDDEAKYSLNSDGSCSGNDSRWYEHDKSMVALSAKFPTTIFKLHGDGEENGDLWDKYFAGGKLQHSERLKTELAVPDLDAMVPPPPPSQEFTVTLTLTIPAASREALQQILDTATTYDLIDMASSMSEVIGTEPTASQGQFIPGKEDSLCAVVVTVADVVDLAEQNGHTITEERARELLDSNAKYIVDGFLNSWEQVLWAAIESDFGQQS